ncbi:MAG: Calx-beta domain-containing protein [Pseudomonadota bacterium]
MLRLWLLTLSSAVLNACGGSIRDSDLPILLVTSTTVAEGDLESKQVKVTLRLSAPLSDSVSVDYTTEDASAEAGLDYVATSGSATLAAGATQKSIDLTIFGDDAAEGDETFLVRFSNASSNVRMIGASLEITIYDDDDAAAAALSVGDATASEAAGELTYVVSLDRAAAGPISVQYSTQDDSARAGDDYTAVSGTLEFSTGDREQTVVVPLLDDVLDEGSDQLLLRLNAPVNATIDDDTGVGTVQDDDPSPGLALNRAAVQEGDAGVQSVELGLTLNAPSGRDIVVAYGSIAISAEAGTDFDLPAATLTLPAGATDASIVVDINGDLEVEGDETFLVRIESAGNAELLNDTASVVIGGDDAPASGDPRLTATAVTVVEGSTGAVTLALDSPAVGSVAVEYTLVNGSASSGSDFSAGSGTATIPAGDTVTTIAVDALLDQIDEPTERFALQLGPIAGPAVLVTRTVVVTIEDANEPPALSIADASFTEGVTGDVVVTASGAAATAITFDYLSFEGTAASGIDFEPVTGTGTINAGATSTTIRLALLDDPVDEANETFAVEISNATGAAIDDSTAAITITDDDAAPTLSIADLTVEETAAVAAFAVSLSAPSEQSVTVTYALTDGTATAGSDFQDSSATLTFPAGSTAQDVLISLLNDSTDESNETFTLVLSNPQNATIADGRATATIIDDDEPLSLSIADLSVTEGDSGAVAARFTVALSGTSTSPVLVDYATADGSAVAGSDYAAASGTLSIAAGQRSGQITVDVLGDILAEGLETFTLRLSNAQGATLQDAEATGQIQDNEGTASLTIADATAAEDSGALNFNLSLVPAQAAAVTLTYRVVAGSATTGVDYTEPSGTLTVPAQTTNAVISVAIIDDTTNEGTETITVELLDTAGIAAADPAATGTITDDDGLPQLAVSDLAVAESAGSASIVVSLVPASGQTATVVLESSDGSATAGQDYTAIGATTLTFAPGETSRTVILSILDDGMTEGSETVTLTLRNAVGGTIVTPTATVTINDDEGAAAVSVADATASEAAGAMRFAVTLSPLRDADTSLSYSTSAGSAAAGNDFTASSGTLTIPAQASSGEISVPLIDDVLDEADETFSVTLSAPPGVTVSGGAGNGTITDNDSEPVVSLSALSVAENAGTGAVPLSLSAASGRSVTVRASSQNGTATARQDYTAVSNQIITFPAGQTSRTLTHSVTDDALFEGDETLSVVLTAPAGATLGTDTALVTIADNDSEPTLSAGDLLVPEGNAGSTDALVPVSLSAASTASVSVDYASANGTASAGSDYAAASGTLTFAAGETLKSVAVPVWGDTSEEDDQTFSLTLSNPRGATIADATATITISDDDGASGIGLTTRPSNTSCVVPARTVVPGAIGLVGAFPALPNLVAPMKLAQPPNDSSDWYVLIRSGEIRRFANAAGADSTELYLSIPVTAAGEGGLLGAAPHPDWPTRKEIFVSYYTELSGPSKTRLSRLRMTSDATLPATYTEEVLVEIEQPARNHNGGDVLVGPDRLLYWSSGDGGGANDLAGNAQNTSNLLGNILRIEAIDVAYPSPGYNIPVGNPFRGNAKCGASANASACPEIYAYGLRNPWRMSYDTTTSRLWAGDVGQNHHEEIDIIVAGGNYGWKDCEGGFVRGSYSTACSNPAFEPPVIDYSHQSGSRSVTGGFVYRGSAAPSLTGKYIYADYLTGQIWALTDTGGGTFSNELLVNSGLDIHSFSQGNDGEVYVLEFSFGARIYRFSESGGTLNDNVANSLVDTGCADPVDPTQPSAGLTPYRPVAPFWSDNAEKGRWIGVPDGKTVAVTGNDDFSFPTGSVIRKDFVLGGQLIETRLLMRHPDGDWQGYSYEWNLAQTEAIRNDAGSTRSVNGQTWIYPSQAECFICHTDASGIVLGPEVAQLNSDLLYPSSGVTDNQLEVYNHIDLLTVDVPEPVSALPALVDPFDSGESLEARARAYLHTNCASCHVTGGGTPVDLNLDYRVPLSATQTCDVVPQNGTLGISNARLSAPGDAARSVLVARVNRRDGSAMPPIGSTVIDTDGVQLLTDWINSLSSCP